MDLKTCWSFLVLVQYWMLVTTESKSCARDKSRVVAKIVREKILPDFHSQRVPLESDCPFSLHRDIYGIQEDHKVFEGSGRWTCDFCGKAFVSEFYLDRHFENRHSNRLQTENSICLADECDVFRCDIVSGVSEPDYWDIALCLEDDMENLMEQCQTLLTKCVPKGLTDNQTLAAKNAINEGVCSFLNCKNFWNTPFIQEENPHTALYIVLITMTCFGILIYNFVFYNYFYSDFSETTGTYDPTPKVKHKMKTYHKPQRDAAYYRKRDPIDP